MSDFQDRILATVKRDPEKAMHLWIIAERGFPEQWAKRSARGALVGNIRRFGPKIKQLGYIPPRTRFGDGTLYLLSRFRDD